MSRSLAVAVVLGDPRLSDDTKIEQRFSPEDVESIERMKRALAGLDGFEFTFLDDHGTLLGDLAGGGFDLALNFCDTGWRNDATRELHVPAYLEMIGLPYSGAGPTCLALAYDKAAVRAMAATAGVGVPREVVVPWGSDAVPVPPAFPAIVKPRTGDGSVGIDRHAVVADEAEARERIAHLRELLPGRDVLIQEFLGGEEYAVGVLGNPPHLRFLPILGVDYGGLPDGLPRILSYESKTVPESAYWTELRYVRAEPSGSDRERMIEHVRWLFVELDCRDYARFDFRAGADGRVRLLETNPNPAWCWDGKMNLMAGFAGMEYADFLIAILDAARARTGIRQADGQT